MTSLPFLLAAFSDLERSGMPAVYALLALTAVLFLNVLSHAISAYLRGGYTPGLGPY